MVSRTISAGTRASETVALDRGDLDLSSGERGGLARVLGNFRRAEGRLERELPDGHVDRLTFLGWEIESLPGTPGLFWSNPQM